MVASEKAKARIRSGRTSSSVPGKGPKPSSSGKNGPREVALRLAQWNAKAEPNIREILLFPDKRGEEIRLVEVDPTALPSDEGRLVPFYFAPDPVNEIPLWSAIALILPREKGKLRLPKGWGKWDQAEIIWQRKARK